MKNPNISLGQYLREHRELKGLSIDEAAIETNIAKKYIEALEKDEYGFFPAEMYVTGFLTAYIEVLELDKELVLSMYRRFINKEQEAPLEAFYNFQTSSVQMPIKKYVRLTVLIISVVGIVAAILFGLNPSSSDQSSSVFTEKPEIKQVAVSSLTNNRQITIGVTDTLVMMDDNNQKIMTIEFLGKEKNKKMIHFKIAQNQYTYKNGDILNTDISGNGVNDLKLEIVSINTKDVELELQYDNKQAQEASFFDISSYRSSIRNTIPVATVTNVHTFNATVTVTRPVWIAYQADTVSEQQKLLNPGDTIRFSFIDGAKLSLGNAGAATIAFSEFTNVVRGGTAGESSQSLFYKKTEGNVSTLYRSQLK